LPAIRLIHVVSSALEAPGGGVSLRSLAMPSDGEVAFLRTGYLLVFVMEVRLRLIHYRGQSLLDVMPFNNENLRMGLMSN
jgi:hypothetical protein